MIEPLIRIGIVTAVTLTAVVIARHRSSSIITWPVGAIEGPAIVFFSSRTCDSCREARRILDEAVGADAYLEMGWEDDPERWAGFGVETVPTTVLVNRAGRVVGEMVGAPDSRRLRRFSRKL